MLEPERVFIEPFKFCVLSIVCALIVLRSHFLCFIKWGRKVINKVIPCKMSQFFKVLLFKCFSLFVCPRSWPSYSAGEDLRYVGCSTLQPLVEHKHIHYVDILMFIDDCQNASTMAVVAAAIVDVCWPHNEYRCIWAMTIITLFNL